MNSALMFSRVKDDWRTPADLFAVLDAEFHFELDVAASLANTQCATFFAREDNALERDWLRQVCWLNPPYSQCRAFVAKAVAEAAKGCTVVVLVPARTDTRWWHESVWDGLQHRPRPGVEVRFLKGRLQFVGARDPAPFPSVVLVFRPFEQDA